MCLRQAVPSSAKLQRYRTHDHIGNTASSAWHTNAILTSRFSLNYSFSKKAINSAVWDSKVQVLISLASAVSILNRIIILEYIQYGNVVRFPFQPFHPMHSIFHSPRLLIGHALRLWQSEILTLLNWCFHPSVENTIWLTFFFWLASTIWV